MTLEKAIEILQQIWFCMHLDHRNDEEDAVKLGIEAMKWRALMERDYGSWCGPPLPGETFNQVEKSEILFSKNQPGKKGGAQ